MKTFVKNILPVLLLILFSSCNKQEPEPEGPELPPLTHEGKNTFGCKINGEVWVAEVEPSIWNSDVQSYYNSQDSGRFSVQGNFEVESNVIEDVRLRAYNVFSTGSFELHAPEGNQKRGFDPGYPEDCTFYHDYNNPGSLEITYFNTNSQIISGKFEMDLVNLDCSQDTVMHITEGRFDVRY